MSSWICIYDNFSETPARGRQFWAVPYPEGASMAVIAKLLRDEARRLDPQSVQEKYTAETPSPLPLNNVGAYIIDPMPANLVTKAVHETGRVVWGLIPLGGAGFQIERNGVVLAETSRVLRLEVIPHPLGGTTVARFGWDDSRHDYHGPHIAGAGATGWLARW